MFRRKPKYPLIVVDFDGVIHSYESGWQGVSKIPDPPVPGALHWLRMLYERAEFGIEPTFEVAILSSRSRSIRGRMAMKRWLAEWLSVEYGQEAGPHMDPIYADLPHWIRWPMFKPAAFLTIDDRAITFTGEWAMLWPEVLQHFKPWNRGGPTSGRMTASEIRARYGRGDDAGVTRAVGPQWRHYHGA